MGPQDGIPSIRCPYCAEQILETDRRCRFCKEAVDPHLRGKYAGGAAYWDGDYLRVPLGGFIRRSHCIVCAKEVHDRTMGWTFRHVPRLYWTSLILSYLGLILIAIGHERQEMDVPVCRDCEARWRQATRVFRLFGVLALLALPISFGIVGHGLDSWRGAFYGVVVGLLVWGWGLFALHALLVRRTQPVARTIDTSGAVLRLPNASLLQTTWEESR